MQSFLPSLSLLLVLTCIAGCGDNASVVSDGGVAADAGIDRQNPSWTDASHGNGVDPDYATVFPAEGMHRIELTISAEDWAAMQADLSANLSTGPGPGGATADFTPMWSEATLTFEGAEWDHVGIRFKGNSSLQSAFQTGTKFPFKLDFDQWEDTYPSVQDQRFYGFKQLNLGSNYKDGTFMRERVAADLFREFGVPAAHVAFCEVYLDNGSGLEFAGVYALIEEVDDTVYGQQFPDDTGNLYKPEGNGATFALGTFNTADLDLKTNEIAADYSDVMALYDVLHDASRTTDVAAWRASLEAVFDVDNFLRYLAANEIIQNWDSYGVMPHNYFLYRDRGVLTWIPWDNNESFSSGVRGREALSLGLDEVSDQWPFIRYIIDVDDYRTRYIELLQEFSTTLFTTDRMAGIYASHEATLMDAALQENANFASDVDALTAHVATRVSAVEGL